MRPGRAASLAAVLVLVGCTIERRTDRSVEEPPTPSASEFLRPWGESTPPAGVKSGDLVWVWAMAGTVPGALPSRLVGGGIGAETRQALENVVDVLEAAGGTARDVAQCSVFLADVAEADAMRAVYTEYFLGPPQRTAIAVAGLALGARVEIECTAVLPSGP